MLDSVPVDNYSPVISHYFPRFPVLHGDVSAFREKAGQTNIEDVGNSVIVFGVPPTLGVPDPCLGTINKPSEVGLDNSVKLAGGPPFNSSVAGLSNLVAANSSEPIVGQHSSPSFEFVLDSFDGLENSFNWKENLGDLAANQGIPSNLHAFSSGSIPRSWSNNFLNPAHKRAVSLSVREALEAPSTSNCSPPFGSSG
ncbi:hypothetical protein V6N13_014452 [Hibiscus sabdariffa]